MTSYQPIENHTSVKLFVTVVLAIWLALVFFSVRARRSLGRRKFLPFLSCWARRYPCSCSLPRT